MPALRILTLGPALAALVAAPGAAAGELDFYRARALERDASAQRVLADCLALGACLGLAAARPVQACAWRIVILGAGDGAADPSDFRAYNRDCGRSVLTEREGSLAVREAAGLFRSAYGRELPPARVPPLLR